MNHDWVKSRLGHGDAMCSRCRITNREAAVLGMLNDCDVPPIARDVMEEAPHLILPLKKEAAHDSRSG